MNARVRLVSSETVAEDANIHDAHENAEGRDEAPIGLPEEGGSNRNDGLGEAPPPLIAEREDRAVGADDATAETKKGVAKLIALAWRRRAKAPTPAAGEGKEGERKEGAPDSAEGARQPDGEAGNPSSVGDNHPAVDDSQGRDGAAVEVAAKSQRPMHKRKGALAVALAAGVAIPAIVVLNWPHSAAQPVEPGMLADGQTKVMAPSAALATAPPREALNVSLERPLVNETRRDELNEMLSFKAGDKAADGLTPKADAPAAVPAARLPIVAETHETAEAPSAHPTSERSAVAPSAPEATPPAPIDQAKSADAAQTPVAHAVTALSLAPTLGAVARDPAPSTAPEPGLGGAAKIEARLADLETAVKDRSNEARARLDAEKAETHTLEKIAELGALVTRLTGQVKDLQDKVQTLSTGADEKFADLTRRVALGEANRAVASAENAGSGGLAGPAREKGSADGSEAQERTRMKVAAADVKRNYRIQAASPGLAMLTAVDGSPDDRPVEVAIGTELPGYG
ncbi:MAG: hypothetical protein WB766_15175, partial [Roseiarcus sp.]